MTVFRTLAGQASALVRGSTRRDRRRRNHVLIALAVGIAFTLIAVFVQPFTSIVFWASDQLFLPTTPNPNITIVEIDDATLSGLKWSEWPRSLHAQAIDNLSQAGPHVIAFDVLFAGESSDDAELAEAMSRAGNVVLPVAGDVPTGHSSEGIVYTEFIHPVPALEQAAAAIGHANVASDGDGVVRRIPLVASDSTGSAYPALVLAILHAAYYDSPIPDDYDVAAGKLQFDHYTMPVDSKLQMRVNFVDRPGLAYTRVSYGDVVSGEFDEEDVRNRFVIVGMTATGQPDSWVTPVSEEKMYGVEIYANAIDTILGQRYLTDASRLMTGLIVLGMAGVSALLLPVVRLRWGALIAVLLFGGYLIAAFFAFDGGVVLNVPYPLIALLLVWATAIVSRVVAEQSDKRQIRDLFGRYVSLQVAGEILSMANTDQLKLGGVRRETTVLFADIRGFTTLSEQQEPESVVSMLNTYLSMLIESILANDGMINKFAGDSVMAVWNAPQDQPDHALLAVKAALEGQRRIREAQKDAAGTAVQFGIGINTGPAVAGNVGSEGRSEYTLIGDTVNLASRICANTPGEEVWIGRQTYDLVRESVDAEKLEPQQFKGKAEAVEVYKVLGVRD